MKLDELEKVMAPKAKSDDGGSEFVVGDEEEEEEDALRQDILDATSLLSKCMHLFDYLGDTDLCKTVTKRERETMSRMSELCKDFLDGIENAGYEGEEE